LFPFASISRDVLNAKESKWSLPHQEENERHKKEQEELESKGHSEEQLAALMKELQIMNERNLKAMAEMV